jgi:hypothetical protein
MTEGAKTPDETSGSESLAAPCYGEGGVSIVRRNLMERGGYSPYCGNIDCGTTPRTKFDVNQFVCLECGWKSDFPKTFIEEYKKKWGL